MKFKKGYFISLSVCTILCGIILFFSLQSRDSGEEDKVIENAWVIDQKNEMIRVFYEGKIQEWKTHKSIEKNISDVVADITLQDDVVVHINAKNDTITERIVTIEKGQIELEDQAVYKIGQSVPVYKMDGKSVTQTKTNELVLGYPAEFIVDKDVVKAVVQRRNFVPENIRVLISTSTMGQYYHQRVEFVADKTMTVTIGLKSKRYQSGEKVTIQKGDFKGNYHIKLSTEGGRMKCMSIDRISGHPSFRGNIELKLKKQGIIMVNELPFEEYLYGVIPSEMPSSYGLEAAKVQAVCARSFGYTMINSQEYSSYGAHLDDSVLSQVYNNIEESELSIQSVRETKGQCLSYKNRVIAANYFSTSCGTTSNVEDVWSNASQDAKQYLMGKVQNDSGIELDLSDENDFYRFIKDDSFDSYDKEYPAYRWHVKMDMVQLTRSVNQFLQLGYDLKSEFVQVYDAKKNRYFNKKIKSVGIVRNVTVHERSKTGQILSIIVSGSDARIKVNFEYQIRKILAPKRYRDSEASVHVTLNDGSTMVNSELLPSAYFRVERIAADGKITSLRFVGGGMGHGVGMSQNGVRTLAMAGNSYEDILKNYYTNIQIKKVY